MQNLYWECNVCDACGVCGRAEDNCVAYHEFFQIKDVQIATSDLYSEFTQYEAPVAAPAKQPEYKHAAGL